jgi:hypothetical protein
MMGYALCIGQCFGCKKTFGFNPMKVPSVRIRNGVPDPNGEREPICMDCVELANPHRVARGLAPITYDNDAYGACDEIQLP